MAVQRIVPAEVDFSDPEAPRAPAFGDVYHARQGAFAQARHVFLAGNGLPARWAGRARFVVLETGFGLGNNFLATWAAWRDDPARPGRLVVVSVEKHPLRPGDLARAHARTPEAALAAALQAAWPPLTPGLHRLAFEDGRVELLLAFGDLQAVLPQLVADVDAFFLDGFAPDRNAAMWDERVFRAVSRLAAPDATAATWSAAAVVRDGLRRAGFEVEKAPGTGGKRDITRARFAPRVMPARPAFRPRPPAPRRVAVVGAGLAGAFAARALAAQGLEVEVFDRAEAPATAASGNPGGLFHGILNPDDGPHARAHRAAALLAQATYREACAQGVPGRVDGLLRLAPGLTDDELATRLSDAGLDAAYVQAWPAWRVREATGADAPAGCFTGGGWISPPALARWALSAPGVRFTGGVTVRSLHRLPAGGHGPRDEAAPAWQLRDEHGYPVATVDAVVLAGGIALDSLLAALPADTPVAPDLVPPTAVRGQIGVLAAGTPGLRAPSLPVAGGGYALTLEDGRVVFGATTRHDDADPSVRDADHAQNLERLASVTGSAIGEDMAALVAAGRLSGRTGWRATTPDRLPWVGAVPAAWVPAQDARGPAARAPDQPRHWPRVPGVFVVGGLGSRGLTWAPLAGRLLASWVTDAPWPLEADLVAALDPARGPARAQRG